MRASRRSLLLCTLIACLPGAFIPAVAGTVSFDSAPPQRAIKACVLGGNSLIFHNLSRAALRPDGWVFENPLAPADLTPTGTPGWIAAKNMPVYWTADLSRLQSVEGVDVIYCPAADVDAADDTRLIRAVENGALLWIDGVVTRLQPPRVTPTGGGGAEPDPIPFQVEASAAAVARRIAYAAGEDLLNVPFRLEDWEINRVGAGDFRVTWPFTDGGGWLHETDVSFRPVISLVDAGGAPLGYGAMIAPYGSGAILVTAGNVGNIIASWGTSLSPNQDQIPAFKFAYNAIAWMFGHRAVGPAGTGPGAPVAQAPVDGKWQYPPPDRLDPTGAAINFGPVIASPVHINGRVLVLTSTASDGVARLVCLDAEPEQDLCGPRAAGWTVNPLPDGEPDDGWVDSSQGANYDKIWEVEVLPSGATPRSSGLVVGNRWQDANGDGNREAEEIEPVVVFSASRERPGNGDSGFVYCFSAITGELRWEFQVDPYRGSSRVCDVSTPVVNNGWVYFTASEYDASLPDATGDGVDRTFGRAWCIDLQTGGNLTGNVNTSGAVWVFPDADLDRGDSTTASTLGEPIRALPCFNDPLWIVAVGSGGGSELPTYPTPAPTVTSAVMLPDGILADAIMTVRSPITHAWVPGAGIITAGWASWDNHAGGSEFALAPTPTRGNANTIGYTINREYYGVKLIQAATAAWQDAKRAGDIEDRVSLAVPWDTDFPAPVAHLNSVNVGDTGVRQMLANWYLTPMIDDNPYELLKGCEIMLQDSGGEWERHFMRGPILWQRQHRWNDVTTGTAVARDGKLFAPTGAAIDQPESYPPVIPQASLMRPGDIQVVRLADGAVLGRLSPSAVLPASDPSTDIGVRNSVAVALAGPNEDNGVVAAAVSQWVPSPGGAGPVDSPARAALVGLKTDSGFELHLGPGVDDAIGVRKAAPSVSLQLLELADLGTGPSDIPPSAYEIDYARRIIRIRPDYVSDAGVIEDTGANVDVFQNPLAGKVVLARWNGTDNATYPAGGGWELHRFGPAHSFAYVPGFIKLNQYPVVFASLGVRLPTNSPNFLDGIPVSGVFAGEPLVAYDYGAGNVDLLPNGWLDMRMAFADVNGNGTMDAEDWFIDPGTEVIVGYTGYVPHALGWVPPAGIPVGYDDVNGFVPIPNPGLGMPAESHQIPVGFGVSRGAPAMAGRTLLLGTEGVTGTAIAVPTTQAQRRYIYGTHWDNAFMPPAGGLTPAETLLAASWDPVTGSVSGRMIAPAQDAAGNVPVVSATPCVAGDNAFVGSRVMGAPDSPLGGGYLASMATERTLIASGSRILECVGSQPVRVLTGSRAADGTDVWPFAHIAKVTRLENGNWLVVDSGANQVLELDNRGCRVWFAGAGRGTGKLLLDRPTDAWRYHTYYAGLRYEHTVIADAGHKRIIEVVRKPASPGEPPTVESAYVVTPISVPVDVTGNVVVPYNQADGFVELEYQKAQPILDPATGELWGYLACAANWNFPLIVEPPRFDRAGNFYAARVNPPPGAQALGAHIGEPPFDAMSVFDLGRLPAITTLNRVWTPWTPIYQQEFRNIRQVQYANEGKGLFGDPLSATFVWVVASRYQAMPAAPMGVYEFQVSPTFAFTWSWTRNAYLASGVGTIPLPTGTNFTKSFFPTSAQRLANGDYLISNLSTLPDHLTAQNTDWRGWGRAFGSEVLRAERTTGAAFGRYLIPDPRRAAWPEPLMMVSYAERL